MFSKLARIILKGNVKIMNTILRIILSTGVPYGIFMGLLWSSHRGLYEAMTSGLMAGLIFGLLAAIPSMFLNNGATTNRYPSRS